FAAGPGELSLGRDAGCDSSLTWCWNCVCSIEPSRSVTLKRVTVLAGLVLGALIAVSPLGCSQQKKSVRLRFTFTPNTTIVHGMEQKRHWKAIEIVGGKDSTISEGKTVIDVTMQEEIRRVLEDSTAEIVHTNHWSFVE